PPPTSSSVCLSMEVPRGPSDPFGQPRPAPSVCLETLVPPDGPDAVDDDAGVDDEDAGAP
ncbi:MAG: hypothetical protein OXR73_18680, partial [Myxococcales bacterium]|nr:hypothetical protein [Myxococcales bacterium]